ncbi:hypothetical protein EV2_044503 [Malus domestica]
MAVHLCNSHDKIAASNAQDSHSKHCRAFSDDDNAVEKSSKRHKHRHHLRCHRHHHGSKKRGKETKAIVDDVEVPSPPPIQSLRTLPSSPVLSP